MSFFDLAGMGIMAFRRILFILSMLFGASSALNASGLEYEDITDRDRDMFTSVYESDRDLYFVDMILKDCKRYDSNYRKKNLHYSNMTNTIKKKAKVKGMTCNAYSITHMESRLTANGKLIGWTFSYVQDYCLAPTISALGAALGNCAITGCRLNVPAGTTTSFVTPSRPIAEAIYKSVKRNKAVGRLSADPNTVQDSTGGCPVEP